ALDFAFLADAAEAEPGRKLYVLGGGIDRISGPSFPLVHPHMALVMRFLVSHDELGKSHDLTVRMLDEDGKELARVDGQMETALTEIAGLAVPVNMVINMANTRFERPGDYAIDIIVNGGLEKRVGLHVGKIEAS
ncbi:MAG: DUF6941 family protein, partial [Actinomycetota bacterium]